VQPVNRQERRRHPRVATRSRCWCETEGVTLYARLLNVSEGGVFICTCAPLPPGAEATLRFCVEKSGPQLAVQAVVAWTRDRPDGAELPGVGLRFVSIDEASVGVLRKYVERAGPAAVLA